MKKSFRIIFFVSLAVASAILPACSGGAKSGSDKVISVSIPPLKFVVESIVGEDFAVETILPAGAAPESYSPTPAQLLNLENSQLLFTTGLLDFERQIFNNSHLPAGDIISVSNEVDVIADSTHFHGNTLAPDPHIWLSPVQLRTIAANVYDAIHTKFPDSVKYRDAYIRLTERIDSVHLAVSEMFSTSPKRMFMVYHPALSYFAKDYGLVQLAIEKNGKEPSAAHIRDIVAEADANTLQVILYQSEYPRTVVETVAADTGAVPVEFNPLNENILNEILQISHIVSGL